MSILGRIFGKKPSDQGQPESQPQQAVLVHLDGAGLPDQVYQECDLATIEDRLIEDIERGGLGEFDGNEVGPGETTLFMAWGTKDFYVEDPDGYIIAFGGRCLDQLPIIAQACG